ncbi:MAG TPA: branched-chain amino acid ABC transporter ATP-binding protein/permease [Acidimicrobiales bacterium]|nr:branched-chain amino acid ABC transporter ATP-binding protein/permease [Acidimicrobiales bacterium]
MKPVELASSLFSSTRDRAFPLSLVAVLTLFVLWLPDFWTFLFISALTTGLIALSVGIVYGRARMVSLCQFSFAAVGAWVVGWLNVNYNLPFVVMILVGGLAAVPLGALIGLLSLRLRGINLAVATLGFAAATIVYLRQTPFPGSFNGQFVERPAAFSSENRFFLLCAVVFAAVVSLVGYLDRRRVGRAWLAVRYSERATAAVGMSVARVKLAAFSLGAFVAAVGGGLLVGQNGIVSLRSFEPFDSLLIFAVAALTGARYVDGAIGAGLLGAILPELFRRWGIPLDVAPMLFGVGAIYVLSQGAEGAHGQLREQWRARRASRGLPTEGTGPARVPEPAGSESGPAFPPSGRGGRGTANRAGQPVLAIGGLTVRYGAVVALDRVDIDILPGTVHGLIGPNGAGKSTLIDTVTGFVEPAAGRVLLEGSAIDRLPVHKRARAGVRRTFQQGRAIPDLTVGQYLQLAGGRPEEFEDLLVFMDCPPVDRRISEIDMARRRPVEVAASLLGRPRVVLLDEPGAGLAEDESAALARRIADIPERFGCAVLLVEHDMTMVVGACDGITVLDFGETIASGPVDKVLEDPRVVEAYLGVPIEGVSS